MFKVLIVDDEEIIREGLRSAIDWESLDCKVIGEAEDGDIGFELTASKHPDIVFADIRMPGLNGLEMISEIKKLNYTCKIIILTGFRDFEYAQEAVKLGAFRLLLKPTKKEELMLSIETAIKELKKSRTDQELVESLRKKIKEHYGINTSTKDSNFASENSNASSSKYLVSRALNFMKTNYSKDLNLKTLADELFISTWYLSKILKKETGSSFIDLLNDIRIDAAKKLLHEPQYKIYEIAEKVGFSDVAYFNKLFKKLTSLKPMEYRNKYR